MIGIYIEDNLVLGIDAGNYKIKTVAKYGSHTFSSAICDWFQRDIEETFGDDLEFEIDGRLGYMGDIAKHEDTFGGEIMYSDSKAHDDSKVKVLISIHGYLKHYNIQCHNVSIIVGQPIGQHNQKEKEFIQDMLKGYHECKINGIQYSIRINDIRVAGEGSGAFWSSPTEGKIRIIDLGSGTCNMVSIIDKKVINTSSTSLNFGVETGKNKRDFESMARGIIRGATRLQWKKEDKLLIIGGVANEILPYIKSHFIDADVMIPILRCNNENIAVNPTYANAVGFYNIARGIYE